MNLTFILHFDASKIADPVLAKSQYLAISAYCKEHHYNLLARETFYHDESWPWSKQTLKLAYDYLWGDFGAEENKIEGVVIVELSTNLITTESSLKEIGISFPNRDFAFTAREGMSMYLRNSNGKEVMEIWLKETIA